jgi:hypothetical protein
MEADIRSKSIEAFSGNAIEGEKVGGVETKIDSTSFDEELDYSTLFVVRPRAASKPTND